MPARTHPPMSEHGGQTEPDGEPSRPKFKKLSTSARCFLGMGLGVLVGVLIGPYAAWFNAPSSVFLQLLKMTVIPYLVVSLVMGLGSLTPTLVARVGKASLMAIVSIWLLSIGVVYSLGVTFPQDGSARFHTSTSSVEAEKGPNIVELFIPDNPFQALAEGTVPAVVLFLLLVSLALLEHPSKQLVLDVLDPIQHTLVWVTNKINTLLPLGVFFLTAQVAGTMTFGELAKLGLYVTLYGIGTAVLCFWLLPLAVSFTTPYRFRAIQQEAWAPITLALGTGSAFVALPTMMEAMRNLVIETEGGDGQSEADAVIPVAYNFPHAGTMFNFLFLLFTASAYGVNVPFATHLKVIATGIPALFSGGVFAMGFLLDEAGLPSDALELYLNIQSITVRLKAALAVVSLLCTALWIHSALKGHFRLRLGRLAALVLGTYAVLIVGGLIARPYLTHKGKAEAEIASWTLVTSKVEILDAVPSVGLDDTVTRMRQGGAIYAGYFPDRVPYSYRNAQDKTVGYTVAMADQFGRDLNTEVKLVPLRFGEVQGLLEEGKIDTVFGPVPVSGDLEKMLEFSTVYDEELPYLVVRDKERDRISKLLSQGDLSSITVATYPGVVLRDARLLRGAGTLEIPSQSEFLESSADALLTNEVMARAFQLQEPAVHALQLDDKPIVQLALPVRPGNAFRVVLDTWVAMRRSDGTFEKLEKTWIDGQADKSQDKRVPLISL